MKEKHEQALIHDGFRHTVRTKTGRTRPCLGGWGIGVLSYMDFQVSSGLYEKPTTGYNITILDIYIQVFPIRYDK